MDSLRQVAGETIKNITSQILTYRSEIDKVLASSKGFEAFTLNTAASRALLDAARAFTETSGDFKKSDAPASIVPFSKDLADILSKICSNILHFLSQITPGISDSSSKLSSSVVDNIRAINFVNKRISKYPSLLMGSSPLVDSVSSPIMSPVIPRKILGFSHQPCTLPASGSLRQLAASSPLVCDKKKGVSMAHAINSRLAQESIISFQKAFKPYEDDALISFSERGPSSSNGIVLTSGYTVEIGSESLVTPPRPIMISDPSHFDQIYSQSFFGYDHWNFVGVDAKMGPVVVSMIIQKRITGKSGEIFTILTFTRTKAGEKEIKLIAEHKKKDEFGPQDAIRAFKKQFTEYSSVPMELVERGDLELSLCDYEEKFHTSKFKFGVLFATGNQGSAEDEMYGNETGDALFENFLTILGTRINLRGWESYRGGLDTSGDATGAYSVYTDWRGFEIMFHVSTLLPFSRTNPQQVERKRHIGNDIVVLVFHTGKGEFNPACFRSHFNHVFIVVRPVLSPGVDEVHYTVSTILRGDVQFFPPKFPRGYQFNSDEFFREFILSKLMNAELAALKSAQFAQRLAGVRKNMLNEIVEKMTKNTELTAPPHKE